MRYHVSILLPVLSVLTSAIVAAEIATTNLTAQHFPELGSRRVKTTYGSHVVQSRKENDGMSQFQSAIAPPCVDCTITFMQAGLEYLDGTTADATTNMWMHHVVLLNRGRKDSVCADMPAQRFFASGNERTAIDLTSTFSALGTQHLGYPVAENDTFVGSGELMNMLDTPQEVMLFMVWEFIPAPPIYFKPAVPFWLDVGGCGDSDVPAKPGKQFEYISPVLTASSHWDIAFIGGHLHDGGTHLDVIRNDEIVCTTEALYGTSGFATGHIARMQSCLNAGSTLPGDQFYIKAYYDTNAHTPMTTADNDTLEPVMGIALAYLVASETTSGSWFSRVMLIYVVLTAVVVTGLAGLYTARQRPDALNRLLEHFRGRQWQRVRTTDPETDGLDAEDGLLLHGQKQTKYPNI
ncbi:hypothetical protein LTR56_018798 [Elasticomyces elasticus]|nr:hypothetical protein LTR56_018798 [Elasticomyces elasticus]KAK3635745.1 hypothetical protein LTR22_019025 [Elasticomyces elasticus]KAK4911904.1 hypothetical protein LTR49_019551 [Elasticomyces elasticus]KAK5740441.1 hypothetical protein LTS12_024958 [Elasticomyces elasticus]